MGTEEGGGGGDGAMESDISLKSGFQKLHRTLGGGAEPGQAIMQ